MSRRIGFDAEAKAAEYLQNNGYKIIATNVRYKFGEIDIVALQKDILVFVEVKFRSGTFMSPFEAVGTKKQRRLVLAAQAYIAKMKPEPKCRFDVIALSPGDLGPKIDHITDAFWAQG